MDSLLLVQSDRGGMAGFWALGPRAPWNFYTPVSPRVFFEDILSMEQSFLGPGIKGGLVRRDCAQVAGLAIMQEECCRPDWQTLLTGRVSFQTKMISRVFSEDILAIKRAYQVQTVASGLDTCHRSNDDASGQFLCCSTELIFWPGSFLTELR